MSDRKRVHVVPMGNKWAVKEQGNPTPRSTHNLKERAIEEGKEVAKSAPLGQIFIHGLKGQIQTEHTYGKDPREYRG